MQAVADGRIKIMPDRFWTTCNRWLGGIRDWCMIKEEEGDRYRTPAMHALVRGQMSLIYATVIGTPDGWIGSGQDTGVQLIARPPAPATAPMAEQTAFQFPTATITYKGHFQPELDSISTNDHLQYAYPDTCNKMGYR